MKELFLRLPKQHKKRSTQLVLHKTEGTNPLVLYEDRAISTTTKPESHKTLQIKPKCQHDGRIAEETQKNHKRYIQATTTMMKIKK